MFDIAVLVSSGEEDEYQDISETFDINGTLLVVRELSGQDDLNKVKTFTYVEENGTRPRTIGYRVLAMYSPGMWMRVLYS